MDSCTEPGFIDAEAVQPIRCGDNRFYKALQSEITKEPLHVFIAGANLLPDRVARRFSRQIETALFVENSKGGIDAQFEAMITDQHSAEAMNRRNGSGRQQRDSLHPLSWLGG